MDKITPIQVTDPYVMTDLRYSMIDMDTTNPFTEAVFVNGKQTVKPIEDGFAKLRDELNRQVNTQVRSENKGGKIKFDPNKYWRNPLWRQLEDTVMRTFGFRTAMIAPFKEAYVSKDNEFESKMINAMVYSSDRYPIEGLLTDKGFYDKSRSTQLEVYITLGLIRELEPDEITAVFLHELGHGIDPALVDISYTETNILTKYMTDRKAELKKPEVKVKQKTQSLFLQYLMMHKPFQKIKKMIQDVKNWVNSSPNRINSRLEKIRHDMETDNNKFVRQNYAEAYADNFARMYGYGPALMRGIKKMSKRDDDWVTNRFKKERMRQLIVVELTEDALKNEHKTEIHRARALINEYKADLKNDQIPATVKKQLREDLHELETILDSYMNDFSKFQNRVNQMINDELEEHEVKDEHDEKDEGN